MKLRPHLPWLIPMGAWLVCLAGIGIVSSAAPAGKRDTYTRKYDHLIRQAAKKHMPPGWDWRILKALVHKESNFNPKAKSRVGAIGLCQLMPRTGKEMGLRSGDFYRPERNIDAGAKYMRVVWDYFRDVEDRPSQWERTRLALASYNAGMGRVRSAQRSAGAKKWSMIASRLPAETQGYVNKIIDEYLPEYQKGSTERYGGVQANTRGSLHFWTNKSRDRGNRRR